MPCHISCRNGSARGAAATTRGRRNPLNTRKARSRKPVESGRIGLGDRRSGVQILSARLKNLIRLHVPDSHSCRGWRRAIASLDMGDSSRKRTDMGRSPWWPIGITRPQYSNATVDFLRRAQRCMRVPSRGASRISLPFLDSGPTGARRCCSVRLSHETWTRSPNRQRR